MEVGSEKWQRHMVDLHRQWATSRRRVSLQLYSHNDGGYLTRFTAVLRDLPLSVHPLALNPNVTSLTEHADGIQALLLGLVKREVPASDWLLQGVVAIGTRGSTGPVFEFLTACAPLFKEAAQVLGSAVSAEAEPRSASSGSTNLPLGRTSDDVSVSPANVGSDQLTSEKTSEIVLSNSQLHLHQPSPARLMESQLLESRQDYQTTIASIGISNGSPCEGSEAVQFLKINAQNVGAVEICPASTQIQLREQQDLTRQLSAQLHQFKCQLADTEEKAQIGDRADGGERKSVRGMEEEGVMEELHSARGAIEAMRVVMMGQEEAKEALTREVSALQNRLSERDGELDNVWALLHQEHFRFAGGKNRGNVGSRGKVVGRAGDGNGDGGGAGDGDEKREGWDGGRGGAKVRRVETKLVDVIASLLSELGIEKEGRRVAESRLAKVQVAALTAEVQGLRREARLPAQAIDLMQTTAGQVAFVDKAHDTGSGIAWNRILSLHSQKEGGHSWASKVVEGSRRAEKLCGLQGVKVGSRSPVKVTRRTFGKELGTWRVTGKVR